MNLEEWAKILEGQMEEASAKLDFERGIPDEHRTLVVVPSLLEGRAGLAQLLGVRVRRADLHHGG